MMDSPNRTQALITMSPGGALTPGNFEGLWRLSEIMAASGMMPKSIERPETVFVAVQMGLEVGLSPMQAVQNIAVVNGRPTIWGDAMLGLVRGSGILLSITETLTGKGDEAEAVCTVTRKDDPGETVGRFSVADAKRAGLWGKAGPWTQYPKRMLQMRARGFALRDKFPDVLKGLYAREEVEPEHYMGQVEVLSSAAQLREIVSKAEEAKSEPVETETASATSAEWPKTYNGNLYDSRGIVWDGTIHSGGKSCNADGSWRKRKGVADTVVASSEARHHRIDVTTAFSPVPAVDAGAPAVAIGVMGFPDLLSMIEAAQSMEELELAIDAGKDVDMDDDERSEIGHAIATQEELIERMQS